MSQSIAGEATNINKDCKNFNDKNNENFIVKNKKTFYCDGINGNLPNNYSPHPKVYLIFNKNTNQTVCPYCGTHFVFLPK